MLAVALLATAAPAQPLLSSDSLEAVTSRAIAKGMLSESSAAVLRGCAEAGVPVTRYAVLQAVQGDVCIRIQGTGCGMLQLLQGGLVSLDSLSAATGAYWPDSLRAIGVLTDADVGAIEESSGRAFDVLRRLPARASLIQFELIAQTLLPRERLAPRWLADDVEHWERYGLVSANGAERVLEAARAGRIRAPADVVSYLDAFVVTDVRRTGRYGSGNDQAALFLAGVDLLRRRGVLDLEVEDVSFDSVRTRWYDPHMIEPGAAHGEGTVARLSATVDGRRLAQRGVNGTVASGLLARILRDRGAREQIAVVALPHAPDESGGRIALGVLTAEQRAAFVGMEPAAWPPARRAFIESLREVPDAAASCEMIAWRALHLLEFDVSVGRPVEPDVSLATDAVGRALEALEGAGLFDDLTPPERLDLRRSILERHLGTPRHVLEAIPNLVLAFGGENAYPPAPYAGLLQRFAEISRGAFAPTDIEDGFRYNADSVRVAFVEGGRSFEIGLRVSGEWLDSRFLRLVVEATDGPGAFYRLGPFSDSGYAYLTPAQYAVLEDAGFIPEGTVAVSSLALE